MENKIEDLIRDDFRKREIQPNANAFERLQLKLDVQKSKRRKKRMKILAIAASLIGLVFVTRISFIKPTVPNQKDQIITNVKPKDAVISPVKKDTGSIAVEEYKESIHISPEIIHQQKSITVKESEVAILDEPILPKKEEKNFQLATAIAKETIVSNDTFKTPITIKEVTDDELDALLATASQSLSKNKKDSIYINSKTMLYEIEVEINKPMPEKVLLTLKTVKELVKTNDKENN